MINAMEDDLSLVKFSNATMHDQTFLKELDLKNARSWYLIKDTWFTSSSLKRTILN